MHVAKGSKSEKFSFIGKATTANRLDEYSWSNSRQSFTFGFSSTNQYSVQLIYEKLPSDISDRHVLLLDPILGTGKTRNYAI